MAAGIGLSLVLFLCWVFTAFFSTITSAALLPNRSNNGPSKLLGRETVVVFPPGNDAVALKSADFPITRTARRESNPSSRDALTICSWNIFRFGPAKFSVPDLLIKQGLNVTRMDVIVDQLSVCDIVAVQEYMDVSGHTIEKLRAQLVLTTGRQYAVALSPRVGQKTSFEQYVFMYRTDLAEVVSMQLFPDHQGERLFIREPVFVKFRLLPRTKKSTEFVLGTIHTTPEEAVKQISDLVPAFDWAVKNFSTVDVMVLGDYNGDCSYVRARDWKNIPLWTDKRFTWLIPTGMGTTSMSTHCSYDRAVYLGDLFRKSFVEKSADAPDFPKKFGLTPAQAKLVSDHRLIKMDFLF